MEIVLESWNGPRARKKVPRLQLSTSLRGALQVQHNIDLCPLESLRCHIQSERSTNLVTSPNRDLNKVPGLQIVLVPFLTDSQGLFPP